MFSTTQNRYNSRNKYKTGVTNPFWAYNPEIKLFGDTFFNFGSHVVPRDINDYKICIPSDASEKEIAEMLKDSDISGRSFFGYDKKTAEIITKAADRQAAVSALNILLNTNNKTLKAVEVYKHLSDIVETQNIDLTQEFLSAKAV